MTITVCYLFYMRARPDFVAQASSLDSEFLSLTRARIVAYNNHNVCYVLYLVVWPDFVTLPSRSKQGVS